MNVDREPLGLSTFETLVGTVQNIFSFLNYFFCLKRDTYNCVKPLFAVVRFLKTFRHEISPTLKLFIRKANQNTHDVDFDYTTVLGLCIVHNEPSLATLCLQ